MDEKVDDLITGIYCEEGVIIVNMETQTVDLYCLTIIPPIIGFCSWSISFADLYIAL